MTKRVLLNYGAIQCLEKLLDLVHEQGHDPDQRLRPNADDA